MKISVILHSYLREKLPAESKGEVTLELPDGSSIQDVYTMLDLPRGLVCALNNQIEQDHTHLLCEDDTLHFFRPAAGG